MQRIEARVGQVIMVGMTPLGVEHAAAGKVWLVAPNLIEESREDVERAVKKTRRRIDKAVENRKTDQHKDG